jgi:hypothetical protein
MLRIQFIEQLFRVFQVGGVEAIGKPVVDVAPRVRSDRAGRVGANVVPDLAEPWRTTKHNRGSRSLLSL